MHSKEQISISGTDDITSKSYEYRRLWIENRIRRLSWIFDIEICSYAVMSNHLHIVLKLCPEQAELWTTNDVLERWTSLYKGPKLIQRHQLRRMFGSLNDC